MIKNQIWSLCKQKRLENWKIIINPFVAYAQKQKNIMLLYNIISTNR